MELIPVKSSRSGLVFLLAKIPEDIRNHSQSHQKCFHNILYKANASLYSNSSLHSGAIKPCKKFALLIREHLQKNAYRILAFKWDRGLG